MQNIISAEGRHISWWFTRRSLRLCWVHFRSFSAKRKYADGRDSACAAGKVSGCQRKWRKWTKLLSVKMLMESAGLHHPFPGDFAVWNFVHKIASADFYLQVASPFQYCLFRLQLGDGMWLLLRKKPRISLLTLATPRGAQLVLRSGLQSKFRRKN